MIYMFLSNNPSSGDKNWSNLPCFKLNEGSTGADEINFGPIQGGGDSGKT